MSGNPGLDLARLEQELHAERAAALVRIANTLERLIARLHDVRAALADTTAAGDRAVLEDAYHATRREALLYRWYLEVQRDAVGLTRHAVLDELYPVPGPLPGSSRPSL
jgi:hypothetical protein